MERETLERLLHDIDKALALNEARRTSAASGSYQRLQLEAEFVELHRMRRTADAKLKALPVATHKADNGRELLIQAVMNERRQNIERFIDKLESENDHRQVRLWRLELARVPEQVAREFGA